MLVRWLCVLATAALTLTTTVVVWTMWRHPARLLQVERRTAFFLDQAGVRESLPYNVLDEDTLDIPEETVGRSPPVAGSDASDKEQLGIFSSDRSSSLWGEDTSGWSRPSPLPSAARMPSVVPRDDVQHPLVTRDDTGPIEVNEWGDALDSVPLWDLADARTMAAAQPATSSVCWEHYDVGMLELWHEKAAFFCKPSSTGNVVQWLRHDSSATSDTTPSWLRCRVTVDKHLPPPTAPHTMCDAANIAMDFTKMTPAKCLRFRPGYNCVGPPYFHHYQKGFLRASCRQATAFSLQSFPKDFLRDLFDSFVTEDWNTLQASTQEAPFPVAIVVTRERNEHANLFHTTTDFLNAFFALHMAGLIDARVIGDRRSLNHTGVIILDSQPEVRMMSYTLAYVHMNVFLFTPSA